MKRTFYLFFLVLSTLTQAQPVKKVMLEEFTGAWCGGCPSGTLKQEEVCAVYPTHAIPVSWHYFDSLEIPAEDSLQDRFDIHSYPTGLTDRFRNPGQSYHPNTYYWMTTFLTHYNSTTAIASVSFSNLYTDGVNFTGDVNVEFYSYPAIGIPIKINVLLTEDSIPATGALEQTNYSSAIENGNDPLQFWKHNSVVQQALGGTWGYGGVVALPVTVGTVYTKPISFSLVPGNVMSNMHAIAYVAYDLDTAHNNCQILNAESIRLEDFISTAITSIDKNVTHSVYPNPIRNGQSTTVSYELKSSGVVEIAIMNSKGERALPTYTSSETAGKHTYNLSLAGIKEHLPAGIYFVQVKANNTEYVERVVVE